MYSTGEVLSRFARTLGVCLALLAASGCAMTRAQAIRTTGMVLVSSGAVVVAVGALGLISCSGSDACPVTGSGGDSSTTTWAVWGSVVGGGFALLLTGGILWYWGNHYRAPQPLP
jgi:hypothetical protein